MCPWPTKGWEATPDSVAREGGSSGLRTQADSGVTFLLCDQRQAPVPLWASVSLSCDEDTALAGIIPSQSHRPRGRQHRGETRSFP